MKRNVKENIAFWMIFIATIILVFNNAGQLFTLVNIPFSRSTQIIVGIISLFISIIWAFKLEKVFK